MAKLSARGATVLAQLERMVNDPQFPELGTWKQVKALRSDHKILQRSAGSSYKIIATLKPDVTAAQWIADNEKRGWHLIK